MFEEVPILFFGTYYSGLVSDIMYDLSDHGSFAVEGFKNPEGIIMYFTGMKSKCKVTFREGALDVWE